MQIDLHSPWNFVTDVYTNFFLVLSIAAHELLKVPSKSFDSLLKNTRKITQ